MLASILSAAHTDPTNGPGCKDNGEPVGEDEEGDGQPDPVGEQSEKEAAANVGAGGGGDSIPQPNGVDETDSSVSARSAD